MVFRARTRFHVSIFFEQTSGQEEGEETGKARGSKTNLSLYKSRSVSPEEPGWFLTCQLYLNISNENDFEVKKKTNKSNISRITISYVESLSSRGWIFS